MTNKPHEIRMTPQKLGRPPKAGAVAMEFLHARITKARKDRYKRAAKDRPLAEWIFEVCDKAAP